MSYEVFGIVLLASVLHIVGYNMWTLKTDGFECT